MNRHRLGTLIFLAIVSVLMVRDGLCENSASRESAASKKCAAPARALNLDRAPAYMAVTLLKSLDPEAKIPMSRRNGFRNGVCVTVCAAPGMRLTKNQEILLLQETLRMNTCSESEMLLEASPARLKNDFMCAIKSANENFRLDSTWNFISEESDNVVRRMGDALKVALLFSPSRPRKKISCKLDGMMLYDAAAKLYDELLSKEIAIAEFKPRIWKASRFKEGFERCAVNADDVTTNVVKAVNQRMVSTPSHAKVGVTNASASAIIGTPSSRSLKKPDSRWTDPETGVIYDLSAKSVVRCSRKQAGRIRIRDGISLICSRAFDECTNLTEVIVPPSVTKIDTEAFRSCNRLRSVQLSEGLHEIGWEAFRGCRKLSELTIPSTVLSIGSGAFDGCGELLKRAVRCDGYFVLDGWAMDVKGVGMMTHGVRTDELVLSSNVKGIADETFAHRPKPVILSGNRDRSYETSLIRFLAARRPKDFPDSVTNEVWVTPKFHIVSLPAGLRHIGTYAFRGTGLEKINLPSGLQTIGESAFAYCTNLVEISIPPTVVNWGRFNHFEGCSRLKRITFGDGLGSLPWAGFHDCRSLTSVYIPASVTNSPYYVFDGCSSLTSIVIAADNSHFATRDGVVYTRDLRTIVCCPQGKTSVALEPNVESVRYCAFSGCAKLSTIDLSPMVTNIGSFAFEKCTSLKSIVIPNGIRELGPGTFSECVALEDVRLPDCLLRLGGKWQWPHLGGCFSGCRNLRKINIPKSCTEFCPYTFKRCGLCSVTLPEGIENVRGNMFFECTNLVSVTMPESVKDIGHGAFEGCSSLREFQIAPNVTNVGSRAFRSCGQLSRVKIPDGVMSIGSDVFAGCCFLRELCIPSSVTNINRTAFQGCYALQKVAVIDKDGKATFVPIDEFVGKWKLTGLDMHSFSSSRSSRFLRSGRSVQRKARPAHKEMPQ